MCKIIQKRQDNLPPVGGKYPLPQKVYTTRHTTNNCVPHDESEKYRQRQLEKAPNGAQLPGRDNQHREATPQHKRPARCPLVGRRVIRHPSWSKGTDRSDNIHRKGLRYERIKNRWLTRQVQQSASWLGCTRRYHNFCGKRDFYRTKVSKWAKKHCTRTTCAQCCSKRTSTR